ncbi:MAG TPA: hypothetical protein VME86_03985 [Acidobacteriaceae bacterium]|nr:hypothetical protein [Acidobacteriaceae bacterium]
MAGDDLKEAQQEKRRTPLPLGYRQGIITAITVLLGFSVVFLRYWGFELPGTWTFSAGLAAGLAVVSILLQMYALWRALQIKDDDEGEYQKTLRWFLSSAMLLLASLVVSGLSYFHIVKF